MIGGMQRGFRKPMQLLLEGQLENGIPEFAFEPPHEPDTSWSNYITMVLTTRTRTAFFVPAPASTMATQRPETLIRLPLSVVPKYEARSGLTGDLERKTNKPLHRTNLWTSEEHERFLQGLELFPNGPWREVSAIVGTKTTRQTMTHAQKYRQKIERRMREKSAAPEKKTRRRTRRKAESAQPSGIAQPPTTTVMPSEHTSFVDLHVNDTCAPVETATSPIEIWDDIFDTAFFENEFDALISSLGPPPPPPMGFEMNYGLEGFTSWV